MLKSDNLMRTARYPTRLAFYQEVLLHALGWTVLIASELCYIKTSTERLESWWIYIVYYTINVAYCYGIILALKRLFTQHPKPYGSTIALYLLLGFVFLSAKALADALIYHRALTVVWSTAYYRELVAVNLARGGLYNILAVFYTSAKLTGSYRSRSLKTEQTLLQQQLDPHLLLNAMNTIYNDVSKHSEDGAQMVWLMAELMRYTLESSRKEGVVPLDQEVEQVRHLIELNKLRYQHQLAIEVQLNGPFEAFEILPLTLLTLTENIFKHGDLTGRNPAALEIRIDGKNNLIYHSRNAVRASRPSGRGGLGLQNLKKRLAFTYGSHYELREDSHSDDFEMFLQLQL